MGDYMNKKKQPTQKEIAPHTIKAKRSKIAAASEMTADDGWERLMKLREELGKGRQSEKSSVEILSEMRR